MKVNDKGHGTGQKNQADQPTQANFQHGLAMTPSEL
jgi:hypothetical protein